MASFPVDRERYTIKLMIFKLIHMLADKLIDEKLEPISIKIDCDKNKYPDIIVSLKDNRNWV